MWVYESASREALVRGDLRGRWALGAAGGASAGAVVWMKREQHLVELVALEGADLDVQSWTVSGECAPWFRYVIGAPKKGVAKPKAKSRRGHHLTTEGRAARAAQAAMEAARRVKEEQGDGTAFAVSRDELVARNRLQPGVAGRAGPSGGEVDTLRDDEEIHSAALLSLIHI